ncbi:hypothetical protein BRARA_B00403 [Brassica rapa]|uniref:Peptidase C19 ubiquitin carboxyl-terminal hydrolase domain-containing protein n=1 Tax=Brassica campestris TaxID=3711 RepID=A0A398A607_BRACM|nr:hypothetical protein BRARA_B00403 [Brassica rapa]
MDNQAKCCLGAMIQKTEEQVFEGSYVIHGKDENESLIKFIVIVHSGGVEDGKYFAIIRPTMTNFWLKIEDGKIKRVDLRRAMDTQQDTPFMLIYIREEDEKETVLFNIDGKFLTEHVNLKENEMDEASLMMIKVCVDSDHDKSCTFKTHKEATFESFKDDVAEYFGVEEHRLRFYTSEAASSLVLSRSYSATVEQVVKSDTVLVKFDTKPGVTGICDLCPRVNLDDVLDMEDYGREPRVIKPKATKRPSKRYNK